MTAPPRVVILRAFLRNDEATAAFARDLASCLERGDILALEGTLGAGKSFLSRAVVNALPPAAGAPHHEDVPSPTFTLVQVYERIPCAVWHFDLYRLHCPEEAYELGIDEAFCDGLSLIEWPERLGSLLPPGALGVQLDFAEASDSGSGDFGGRWVTLEVPDAVTRRFKSLIARWGAHGG